MLTKLQQETAAKLNMYLKTTSKMENISNSTTLMIISRIYPKTLEINT